MKKLYNVSLQARDLALVKSILNSGKHYAIVFRRANILFKAHKGLTDAIIAEHVSCGTRMVAAVRQRFCTEDLERALYDNQRSGRPATLSDKDTSTIVALACTQAPEGHSRWSLDLLVEEAKKKEKVSMGRTKVWTILKNNNLKPWRKKNVVYS